MKSAHCMRLDETKISSIEQSAEQHPVMLQTARHVQRAIAAASRPGLAPGGTLHTPTVACGRPVVQAPTKVGQGCLDLPHYAE